MECQSRINKELSSFKEFQVGSLFIGLLNCHLKICVCKQGIWDSFPRVGDFLIHCIRIYTNLYSDFTSSVYQGCWILMNQPLKTTVFKISLGTNDIISNCSVHLNEGIKPYGFSGFSDYCQSVKPLEFLSLTNTFSERLFKILNNLHLGLLLYQT